MAVRFTSNLVTAALLLLFSLQSASAQHAATIAGAGVFRTITIDGDPGDWAGVPDVIVDGVGDDGFDHPDLLTIKVANDDDHLYFLAEFTEPPVPPNFTIPLGMDTDQDASTGCTDSDGADLGLIIDVDRPEVFLDDASDCGWGTSQFPDAVVASFNGVYVEFSVQIAAIETITPGMNGFALFEVKFAPTSYGTYTLSSDNVGGSITGAEGARILCRNLTSGQSVTGQLGGETSWDCEAFGLQVNPGDVIIQQVKGRAL